MPPTSAPSAPSVPRGDRIAAAAYLRRLPGMDTDAVLLTLTALVAFTERQGLALAAVHYEPRPSERLATWAELIVGCRSEGVANVVVPSPDHFHHDAEIAAFMRDELAQKIQGAVWYAGGSAATTARAGRRAD